MVDFFCYKIYLYKKSPMEKAAKEFLEQSGRLYETNKVKWRKMLADKGLEFSEDIYNDSIIKTYDAILKKEVDTTDYLGYWYQTFLNNTKRDLKYSYHKKTTDDVNDILKEKTTDESEINLYYSAISTILLKVKHKFDLKTFEVFRMYLLCNTSYEKLNELTGLKDCRERISRVRKWLNGKIKI